jgi:hypothetical protein
VAVHQDWLWPLALPRLATCGAVHVEARLNASGVVLGRTATSAGGRERKDRQQGRSECRTTQQLQRRPWNLRRSAIQSHVDEAVQEEEEEEEEEGGEEEEEGRRRQDRHRFGKMLAREGGEVRRGKGGGEKWQCR